MTVTVLVLLGLTLWLTSFGKLRVTITKPADTDPPYTIRKGEPLEVKGIGDHGDHTEGLEVEGVVDAEAQSRASRSSGFPKIRRRPAARRVHWESPTSVSTGTPRDSSRDWSTTDMTRHDEIVVYNSVRGPGIAPDDYSAEATGRSSSNIVKVRVE